MHEFVRLRCCCCSMSRGEMLLLPVEHWLRREIVFSEGTLDAATVCGALVEMVKWFFIH